MTSVGGTENDDNADGVLVNHLDSLVDVEAVLGLVETGNEALLDVEVASKLLNGDLGVGTKDHVRAGLLERLALSLALVLPSLLGGETGEHDSLGRTGGSNTHGSLALAIGIVLLGGLPEVSKHGNATSVHGQGSRVLVLVTGVDHHGFGHELGSLIGHPGVNERGQVESGLAIEAQVRAEKLQERGREGSKKGKSFRRLF